MGTYGTHINGIARSVASSDPDKPLLYALRNLGFTAAKFDSDLGQCGACNVLVDGRQHDSAWRRLRLAGEVGRHSRRAWINDERFRPLPPSKFVLFRCDPSLLHLLHTTAMCSAPLRRLASVAPHSGLRGNAGAQLILHVQEGALGLTTAPRSWPCSRAQRCTEVRRTSRG
jgi:hypothetical protein